MEKEERTKEGKLAGCFYLSYHRCWNRRFHRWTEERKQKGRNLLSWVSCAKHVLHQVWKERNLRIFESKRSKEDDIFETAKWRLCTWLAASKDFRGCRALDFYSSWE